MSTPIHGGDLSGFSNRFGIPQEKILDFSSNVNPIGIPDSVRQLFPRLAKELECYPDLYAASLKQEIARRFEVPAPQIILGNGAMGVLALAIRALKPHRALLIEPSFSEYRRLLLLEGAEIRPLSLRREELFDFSLSNILSNLDGIDLVIFGHPNNPTGTALQREEVKTLLGETERRGIYLVMDEAFADWRPEISCAREVYTAKRLLVVRSFTKFFSIPGVRAGFAFGSREIIALLETYQETWSMNRLAQQIALTALKDEVHERRTRQWFEEESSWFYSALSSVKGLKVYPSLANFFLVKLDSVFSFEELFECLGKRGIYVRPASEFAGLGVGYFRVALRSRNENEFLIAAMKNWLAQAAMTKEDRKRFAVR